MSLLSVIGLGGSHHRLERLAVWRALRQEQQQARQCEQERARPPRQPQHMARWPGRP